MRKMKIGLIAMLLVGWTAVANARDKDLEDLPRDAWDLATVWTEPIKGVARETRRLDPVSGAWFGLLKGSLKSIERTVAFILPPQQEDQPGAAVKGEKLPFHYAF